MKISALVTPEGFVKVIPHYTDDLYDCNERIFDKDSKAGDPIEKIWFAHEVYQRVYYNTPARRDDEIPLYAKRPSLFSHDMIAVILNQLKGYK